MSKFTVRKGSALGATVALALAGLTAAPAAHAAETLALAPSAGAEYAALTTSSFTLAAGFAGTESTEAAGTLKFRVQNEDVNAFTVGIAEGADVTVAGVRYGTTTVELDDTASTSDNATSDDDFVAYSATGTPVIGAAQTITLEPSAGFTDNISVVVQAWLDLDGDNAIDSNEATSPARTLTYYAAKNVTATATLEAPVLAATALTANVTFSPALNVQQLDSDSNGEDVVVKFLENNAVATVSSGGVLTTAGEGYFGASYDSTELVFDADLTNLSTGIAGTTIYGAQALLWDGAGTADADYTAGGSAVYQSVGTGVVTTLAASAVRPGNAVSGTGASSLLREGAGTFTVYADVTAVAAGESVAGKTVTFTIADSALTTGASVTAGGATLTSATASGAITATAVTDADGEAEITVTYAGFVATQSDAFTIEASAVGASAIIQGGGGASSSKDLTLTAHASTGDFVIDNIAGNRQVESVIGSTTSISYTVVDQFGQTPVGEFQLVVTENGSGSFAGTAPVTNGTATFSWVENSPSANDYTVSAALQIKTAGVFGNVGSVKADTLVSAVTAAQVPAAITNTASNDGSSTAVALTLSTQVSVDEDVAQTTVAAPTTSAVYVEGTVTSALGAPLKGVAVTVSSTGKVMLTSDDGKVNGLGTITVRTNTSGVYKVFVTSNSAGKQTVTATAGAATKAEVITFAAADWATATKWSFAGSSATSTSGSTFKVVATLMDAYDNPVDIDSDDTAKLTVSYVGDGITLPTTLPTVTDVNGQLSFSVLLGSNDSNDASVTVSYDLDGSAATTTDITTAAWSVDVNPVAVQKVNAGSFKGYVAVYARGYEGSRLSAKVGKDWVVVPSIVNNQENGTLFRVVEFTGAGYDVAVRIYIDRVLVDTINLTTK